MTPLRFLSALVFVLLTIVATAQTRTYKNNKPVQRLHDYNAIKISKSQRGIVCPVFEESRYPYTGIGIKLGDPFAFTFKFYVNEKFAIVADFGRSASGLYNHYYTSLFEEYVPDPADTLSYFSHKVNSDFVGEFKFLYHFDASGLSPGLRFYTGIGWEVRDLSITYQYVTKEPASPETFSTKRQRSTQGAQVILGLEYANFKLPISAFMELEYYYDLLKDPGKTKLQGGVGLRYIF